MSCREYAATDVLTSYFLLLKSSKPRSTPSLAFDVDTPASALALKGVRSLEAHDLVASLPERLKRKISKRPPMRPGEALKCILVGKCVS